MWSKREQTAGRGCRLSPSAPGDDPPMYIFIYFLAFPNKRSYNYSTPRVASTAHLNVNPTKKVKRTKARWCTFTQDHLYSVQLLKFDSRLCLSHRSPPGVTHLCPERERETLARSFEPVGGVWCLPWSRICGVFDLESRILTSLSFCSLCWIHTFVRTRAQASRIEINLCFFFFLTDNFTSF